MLKKTISTIILVITIAVLLACEPLKEEPIFQSQYPDINFGQINLLKMASNPGNVTYYYETIRLIFQNNSQSSIYIEDERNISVIMFDLQQKMWEHLELEELQIMTLYDNEFPVQIEPGEEADIFIRPVFLNDQYEQSIRIVVTGTSNKKHIGGYLDVQVSPYPGLNFEELSVKNKWPDLQRRAENWHMDAYLINVIIHIPLKREPNGHVVALTFQSVEDTKEELVLLIDKYGQVAEQFNTYSKIVPREKPIVTEQWSIDISEILHRVLVYDPSIEIPSEKCNGIELSYDDSGELSWTFFVSDCKQTIDVLYQIDPNTGEITPLTQ